ncbi:carbohydrate-binding protein [Aquimarina sp. RZ0]|uniref:carbohydrate-binding protein n=1 Tax=Aquimarina sp. RZ0 TaxID=2607730 RepID=UPI0011F1E1AB|nr:carbohydrate-binding protein [Aquimarina sp. RZ0]KAA1243302.1 carbohydrate-binding protein [Aquimarina sp. RZ0]
MKKNNYYFLLGLFLLFPIANRAQNVEVDINLNLKHSVGGVSDFGRDRHITVHAGLTEPDWIGEEEKMKYLLEDLDVYLGRDNGRANFHFSLTDVDAERANYPDIDSMAVAGNFWNEEFENLPSFIKQYESRSSEMIMGISPHPVYPTLKWDGDGLTSTDPKWQPKNIETSSDWVAEYLDKYFAKSQAEDGIQLPKYWEVINEPDMLMMTGQFMVTSQEKLWEYHTQVAEKTRAKLGDKAPLIGGMTWGLHDFFRIDGQGRHKPGYLDMYLNEEDLAIHRAMSETSIPFDSRDNEWYQWDVIWKGFIDKAGKDMDFYAVHIYDWPIWNGNDPVIRSGGHTEAMLDMMEWYDVNKFGTRKPIVLSEYGAVTNYIDQQGLDPARRDWENLKPFSSMLMQFLERPDYIVKTMPFTPIKAEWGNILNGAGEIEKRYPYTMMDKDAAGNWQWSEFIKWYELWSDVKGTRVDTKSSDLDIQVDAYIDGEVTYLILNNLERVDKQVDLNFFGSNGNAVQEVKIKHLFLNGNQPTLSENTFRNAPESITIGAEATMILAYSFANPVVIDETSKEFKYYGESLSGSNGSTPHRVRVDNGALTANVNGVVVPNKGEAMLRLGGAYFWDHVSRQDDRNVITVNGFPLEFNSDWRGEDPVRNIFFGVLEIPIPIQYLRANNVIESTLQNVNTYTNVSIQVWDMSVDPGRTNGATPPATVDVTGVDISPSTITLNQRQTMTLAAVVSPANATNKNVTWSSGNTAIASVDNTGVITAQSVGSAVITVTTEDGSFTATINVTVDDNTPPSSGDDIVIEAETFISTDGTFDDASSGGPGTGVNASGVGINYVNSGDWAEYTINVGTSGDYKVTYQISSPSDNAEVQLLIDGVVVATDAVPNNGGWDTYTALVSSSTVTNLTTGIHTVRVVGSGSNPWQWNLDKITLSRVTTGGGTGGPSPGPASSLVIQAEDFSNTGGSFGGFERYNTGGVSAINFNQTGDWGEYIVEITNAGLYDVEYFVGTGVNGAAIEFILDGTSQMTDNVPMGDWNDFVSLNASEQVNLSSGRHVIRLLGSGTNGWEWNMDRFILSKPATRDSGIQDEKPFNNLSLYPNPTSGKVFIQGLSKNQEHNVRVFDIKGAQYLEEQLNKDHTINIERLPQGIYFLTVINNTETGTLKLIKN